MEYLLKIGVARFDSGEITTLDQILDFIWSSLTHSEARNVAKSFCKEVRSGRYSNYVILHRVGDNNNAFYKIV